MRDGWEARFALLDDFFLERLDDALSPVPCVTRALGRLRASGGSVPSASSRPRSAAAAGTSWPASASRSACRRSCSARILRFQRAVSLVGSRPAGPRSPLRCGYYDQAHMVRDFNQFAGGAPGEFARRRLPDGGGVVGD